MVAVLQLDCNACKTPQAMTATKIPKFSSVVRAIGVILLIPSIAGLGIALLLFISTINAMSTAASHPNANNEAFQTGAAIGSMIGFGITGFVGICSLIGGLLGWLLLLNRNVYKCTRCGFVIDRA
jgi:hypothetical protein